MGIETGSLQGFYALIDACRILLRATALEDDTYSLRILNLLGWLLTTAQQSPVTEDLGATQGNQLCFHTTH